MLKGAFANASETIVVNAHRDTHLVSLIAQAKEMAKTWEDSDLIECFLELVQKALGSYGLPKGATSEEADKALLELMHRYKILIPAKDTTSCY
jgi:hypothetical protein